MTAFWYRFSRREQLMFVAAAVLGAGVLVYASVVPALRYLERLDDDIATLEWRLIQYTEQATRSDAVDLAYARIAAVHGSDLTREAIHDGLRDEIFRLVQRELVPPGQVAPGGGDPRQRILVFTELPEGQLREGLEGYREYSIEFRTIQGPLVGLMEFVRRVQESPLALRVQKLEFSRGPLDASQVTAVIEVARTVVDGVPEEISALVAATERVNELVNPGFEEWDESGASFTGWDAAGLQWAPGPGSGTEGNQALSAVAQSADARLFQEVGIASGVPYVLTVDLAARGRVRLGVSGTNGVYGGAVDAKDDGRLHTYTLYFVPERGDEGALKAPYVEFMDSGAEIQMDNVVLRRLRG